MGFEVSHGVDLDRAAMTKLISDFLRAAATANTAVLYLRRPRRADRRPELPVAGRRQVRRRQRLHQRDDRASVRSSPGSTTAFAPTSSSSTPAATTRWRQKATQPANPSRVDHRADRPRLALEPRQRRDTSGAGTLLAFATAPGDVALDGEGADLPFSLGACTAHQHAGHRGTADVDPRPRRGGRLDQRQAGAVVELVAAWRGVSCRQAVTPSCARCGLQQQWADRRPTASSAYRQSCSGRSWPWSG